LEQNRNYPFYFGSPFPSRGFLLSFLKLGKNSEKAKNSCRGGKKTGFQFQQNIRITIPYTVFCFGTALASKVKRFGVFIAKNSLR
jgi:hypothetical protein